MRSNCKLIVIVSTTQAHQFRFFPLYYFRKPFANFLKPIPQKHNVLAFVSLRFSKFSWKRGSFIYFPSLYPMTSAWYCTPCLCYAFLPFLCAGIPDDDRKSQSGSDIAVVLAIVIPLSMGAILVAIVVYLTRKHKASCVFACFTSSLLKNQSTSETVNEITTNNAASSLGWQTTQV